MGFRQKQTSRAVVARDAVRGIVGLGWGYLFYLAMKLLIDLFLAFVP